eukprot:6183342-Pleurochrysis_carterae.AAC.2
MLKRSVRPGAAWCLPYGLECSISAVAGRLDEVVLPKELMPRGIEGAAAMADPWLSGCDGVREAICVTMCVVDGEAVWLGTSDATCAAAFK